MPEACGFSGHTPFGIVCPCLSPRQEQRKRFYNHTFIARSKSTNNILARKYASFACATLSSCIYACCTENNVSAQRKRPAFTPKTTCFRVKQHTFNPQKRPVCNSQTGRLAIVNGLFTIASGIFTTCKGHIYARREASQLQNRGFSSVKNRPNFITQHYRSCALHRCFQKQRVTKAMHSIGDSLRHVFRLFPYLCIR